MWLFCSPEDGLLFAFDDGSPYTTVDALPPSTQVHDRMSPLALSALVVGAVAFLLFLILYVRVHAFVALLVTSLGVAVVGGIPPAEIIDVIIDGMGGTLGYIAVIIGIGAMIGEVLRQTGGAEQIASTLLRASGDEKAPWALSATGLIVAIPVFFDVALILFIPLVYSLVERTDKTLLYYAIPLVAGIAVAHSFIPPTPGPVAVAGLIEADLGWVILFGLIAGVPAVIVGGVFFGRYIDARIPLGVPEQMDIETVADPEAAGRRTPPFAQAIGIIAFPLALILLGTVSDVIWGEEHVVGMWMTFIGHPITALSVAVLLTFYLLGVRCGYPMKDVQRMATKSLEPVGLIILVTGAGGVLGNVLVETGVGEVLAEAMAASNLPIVLLAFGIAVVVRVSVGSATVSMVTAASFMAPVVAAGAYSAPLLGMITIAIASGATVLSHVNDSGFWLVSRYLGMDEAQTLKSWTVMETIVGGVGLLVVLVLSLFF